MHYSCNVRNCLLPLQPAARGCNLLERTNVDALAAAFVPVLQLPAQPLLLLLTSPTLAALPAASLNFADRLDFILDAELAIWRAAPGARSLCFWNKFVLSVLGEEGQTDMPWSVTCTSTSSSTLNLVKERGRLPFSSFLHPSPSPFVRGECVPRPVLGRTQ